MPRRTLFALSSLFVAGLFALAHPGELHAQSAVPNIRKAALANDHLENAQRLVGASIRISQSTVGATHEFREPLHAGYFGGASVWFAWTAPTAGWVTIDTKGSDFSTLLAVYTGSAYGALSLVTSNVTVSGSEGYYSQVSFRAVAGVDYRIVIDGFDEASGNAKLNLYYGLGEGYLDGVCGIAHGLVLSAPPSEGACAAGTETLSGGAGPFTWTCEGQNGGINASCSAARGGDGPKPVCAISPAIATVKPNRDQVFSATCTQNPSSYRWYVNSRLLGSGETWQWGNAAVGSNVIQVVANNVDGSGKAATAHLFVSNTSDAEAYQGAWWAGVAENGWGLSLIQHGEVLAAGWYYYDDSGQPIWAIIPGCTWEPGFKRCTGMLMESTGGWLGGEGLRQQYPIGTATLAFSDANTGTISWTVRGSTTTKQISRMQYRSGVSPSGVDYSDIWWSNLKGSNWGISIMQQGAALAGIWYTYARTSSPVWYLINGGTWETPTTYSGPLFKATGSPLVGRAYNAAAFDPKPAGTISIHFTSATTATISYTVDGMTETRSIVRMFF
ncbi:MAG: hypothetical protein SF172_16690 [Burkholderiales bacterium]|nr:hypothetical protein [Burkholderiales bacterium]